MSIRREPFRAFFPLGLAIAVAGVVPWLLFSYGRVHVWPGPTHALVMTQGFLAALAVGFLGTMLPRRAGVAPMTAVELGLAGVGLVVLAGGLLVDAMVAAQLAFLLVVGVLGRYMISALRRRQSPRPTPPSFVLLPLGVAAGVAGAVLLVVVTLGGAGPWAYAIGRQLAQQGFMLLLVLALAPMLAPIVATGQPPADPPPARARAQRVAFVAVGVAVLATFAVELWWSVRAGLVARGVLAAVVIFGVAGAWRPGERPGLHRRLFQLALWLVPAGLLAAGVAPLARASMLHFTYVGGLGLLALAVSVHVTVLHTGRDALAERSPALVAIAGLLTLAAAAVRAQAERFGAHYHDALLAAALLWIAAVLAWALFVVPKLLGDGVA